MANDKQVVIAGAGPAGCVAALVLSRAGVSVQVLEAEPDVVLDMRASTFHPPTLDMLDELEVTDKLIAQGLITPKFQFRDLDDGLVAEFDLAQLADFTDHPYRLQCEQFKLTRVITDMLADYPQTTINFNAKVTGVTQNGSGVAVAYEMPDGPGRIDCDYLIGCDGSRSVVRKSQDIGFPGFTYPEHFVTASVHEDISQIVPGMGDVSYISHPTEWCALIHAPEVWRFLFPVQADISHEDSLAEEYLQQRLNRIAGYAGEYSIEHRIIYSVNQRVAENYRRGRVLLAGDSAHVNNPLGGMGMNGGIHDAINVAEKLVSIVNEGVDDDLLDKYDRQRRPIAIEYVQAQSIRNKQMIEVADPAVRRQRQDELRATADDLKKSVDLLLQTSMINAVRKSTSLE